MVTNNIAKKGPKPAKAYTHFPLFAYATGRWAKKIEAVLFQLVLRTAASSIDLFSAACSIIEQRAALAFKHEPDGTPRALFHQGDGQFHPAGAPKVRIVFQANGLMISYGDIVLHAKGKS